MALIRTPNPLPNSNPIPEQVLLSSDVSARGVDYPDVTFVLQVTLTPTPTPTPTLTLTPT